MKRSRGRPRHADQLTPAEWRVAEAVRHGLSNPRIAALLGVSTDAVKFHVANCLAKLGLEDRKALRQWPGIRQDSALQSGASPKTMETPMTNTSPAPLGALGQISRNVKDIAAAEAWFRDVLGLKHLYTFGTLAFFDCDGTRLFLSQNDKAGESESILYFRVANIHSMQETLAGKGVEFMGAPHMIHKHADGTEEWMTFFKDNEGRHLALMAQVGVGSDG
jgi:DNA-binding CsgD family transcriptional regulator/catechol 2,3-dioxygenase-like lactoylglutathione lyase family enzyme